MRTKSFCIVVVALILLCTGASAQQNKNANPTAAVTAKISQQALGVTYIANEGFLIQAAEKKVLVDALFDDGFGTYLAPSQELLAQMTGGRGPFADVDLLLVTHTHGDHFNPKLVAEFLRHHARCWLVAHTQVVDLLRKEEGFAQIEEQIHEVKLEPGAYEHISLNGITFDALCLNHMRDGDPEKEQMKNLAFVVELGGVRFLHLGDARINQSVAHLNHYPFERSPVDILFLNQYDRSEAVKQFIAEKIKPSQIVAMHIPPAELAEETNKILTVYPHVIVFKQSMERRSIPIEVDFHHLMGEYFGQTPPGATPQVFAPGVVSIDGRIAERISFSPDGRECFFSVTSPDYSTPFKIYHSTRRADGMWSNPTIADFSGSFWDGDSAFSSDGKRLYFVSNRPYPGQMKNSRSLWYIEKRGEAWFQPQFLGRAFVQPHDMSYVSASANGNIYFIGYEKDESGKTVSRTIYRSRYVNGEYQQPESLNAKLHGDKTGFSDPYIAPDESFLLFNWNVGKCISFHKNDDSWTEPVAIEDRLSSIPGLKWAMSLSPDMKFLFFSNLPAPSSVKGNIYWIKADFITALMDRGTPK